MEARIIAISNQKGGVGKTTTTLNVGACLADIGKKVLFIDLDPQANLTTGIGIDPNNVDISIYDVLLNAKKGIKRAIVQTNYKNLDIVRGHINLSSAEIEMVPLYGREFVLKKAVEKIINEYDFILIDCPPSLSLLTVNGLITAKELIIPVQAHHFSLDGLEKLLDVVTIIKEEMNEELQLAGVFLTLVDTRTSVFQQVWGKLKNNQRISDKVLKTFIRVNIKLVEAANEGIPIIYYNSTCHGAIAYRELTKEILERGKIWHNQVVETSKR
ncbi:MAG: AAA family ATPase [Candidatus Ancaeobacter aquaticus]|nr:AAA family ATPase [Candidatus Ancaeobacter aquaticus]